MRQRSPYLSSVQHWMSERDGKWVQGCTWHKPLEAAEAAGDGAGPPPLVGPFTT